MVPSAACLKLFKRDNPDFSAESFLGDSKQPPVNSGREFQPVSERRHIRLVLVDRVDSSAERRWCRAHC